ncbi:MAG: UvrD-helicase domain-containing protein [Alphaproteobacteria bacterium]
MDEAQDSNPEQWDLVTALTEEFFAGSGAHNEDQVRTVFAVGDVKQSIYSFQGADPTVFLQPASISISATAANQRFDTVGLHVSFRSVAAVLQAVDAVFVHDNARTGVALDKAAIRHIPSRIGDGGLVELWPTSNPRSEDLPEPWKPPVEQLRTDNPRDRLAWRIARRIRHMLDRNEILEAKGRPIEPRDIMILLRRRSHMMDALVRASKARVSLLPGLIV